MSGPMKKPTKYPALECWRRELAAGERAPTDFDPLWRAACAEVSALEHDRLPGIAASYWAEGRRILAAAARARAA